MYKSAICHLHSSFEGPASIAGFCFEAARYGIDVVWLSDHDTRVGTMQGLNGGPPFTAYDFSLPMNGEGANGHSQGAVWEEEDVTSPAWSTEANTAEENLTLRMKGSGTEWEGGSLRLVADKKNSGRPLFSRPSVRVGLSTNIQPDDANARLIISLYLSQAPPEHERVILHYVWGAPLDENSLPLNLVDGQAVIRPADDAEKLGMSLDHTMQTCAIRVESRAGQTAQVVLTELQLDTKIQDTNEWLQLQSTIGSEVGAGYGVTVLNNYEISRGERHMTCFGPSMPVYPYQDGQRPKMEELSAYAAGHGGVLSINHPFSKWKREQLTEAERADIVEEVADALIERQAGGAAMVEIGFPERRHGFGLHHYLRLWDRLNLADLHIAGIGVSDAHSNMRWSQGNNFANFVASPDTSAENMTAGLRRGSFYMAAPADYAGQLEMTTDQGKSMGDLQAEGTVTLKLTAVPTGSILRWVCDGQPVREEKVSGDHASTLALTGVAHFVRAELYRRDGRCLLLTNPIWAC